MSIDSQLNILTALPAKNFKDIFLQKLKEGSIVTVSVLDKLQDNTLLLNIGSQTFLGSAKQDLSKGTKFLAKVSRLTPRLTMELMETLPKDSPALLEEKIKSDTAKMGVLLNEKTISIINAMKDASIKLTKNNIMEFSRNLSDEIINTPSKLKSAAQLFKSNITATPSLIDKTAGLLETETNIKNNLPEKIYNLNQAIQKLPPTQQSSLSQHTDSINSLIDQMTLKNTPDSNQVLDSINNTRSTHPLFHEAATIKELSELLTDKKELPNTLQQFLKDLTELKDPINTLKNNTPQSEQTLTKIESLLTTTVDQLSAKNIETQFSDKTNPEITIQQENELLHQLLKQSDMITEAIRKIKFTNIDKDTDSFLTELQKKTDLFLEKALPEIKENSHLKTYLSNNTEIPEKSTASENNSEFHNLKEAFNSLKSHLNLKEKLHNLLNTIDKMSKDEPSLEKLSEFKEVRDTVKDLLTEIKGEQLKDSLKLLNPQTPEYLTIPLILPDGKGTLNIVFEQMKNQATSDKKSQFFSVYFSMDLTNLGYFEISLLDNSKNLDLTFFSAKDSIRTLFESNADELKEKLMKLPISSVNLRTLKQTDNKISNQKIEKNIPEKLNTTGIDIIT